jgi:hypothetical protein
MRPARTWLSQLLIQPFMIVLSILAALAVNQWNLARASTVSPKRARLSPLKARGTTICSFPRLICLIIAG